MADIDHTEIVRTLDWSPADLPSLAGKVAIVTGANSLGGIGGNLAQQLALKGARVYIGARSLEKANAGIKSILAESPSIDPAQLKPFVANTADYHAVKAAADQFLKDENRLDILINNAGAIVSTREVDEYGVNTAMATNHLGHFLLTQTVLPLMINTAKTDPKNDVRIVNVSSTVHYIVPPGTHFSTLQDWNNDFGGDANPHQAFVRYGYTKAANILFTRELQRQLSQAATNIIATALHPGDVSTEGAGRFLGTESEAFKIAKTPYHGALTPLWCAVHPEVRKREVEFKGRFFMPFGGVKDASELAKSEEEARGLWKLSEEVLEGVFKV